MQSLALCEAIAVYNVHVRELLETREVAVRFNVPTAKIDQMLTSWATDWLFENPRLGAILNNRVPA